MLCKLLTTTYNNSVTAEAASESLGYVVLVTRQVKAPHASYHRRLIAKIGPNWPIMAYTAQKQVTNPEIHVKSRNPREILVKSRNPRGNPSEIQKSI